MEAHRVDAWHMAACPMGRFERIRQGKTGQPMALAFALRVLGQLLLAALLCDPGSIHHALQRMTGKTQLFAVISPQRMTGCLAVRDTVCRISGDLASGPMPDASQMPEPRIKLLCLRGSESQLQVPWDLLHPLLIFDVLRHHCEWSTTNGGNTGRVRPERGQT